MQVNNATLAIPTPASIGAAVSTRVLAGDLAQVPIGELLQATVTQVNPREAVLSVNGQPVTILTPPGLQLGEVLFARVPGGNSRATIELAPTANAPLASTLAPVIAGNIAKLPPNAILPATVLQSSPRESVLFVAGEQVTVQASVALPAGAGVAVRVPNSAKSAIELFTPQSATATPAAPAKPADIAVKVVDVISTQPDGQVRVRIEGNEFNATSREPLTPGNRLVLETVRTPTGLLLRPPAESPAMATNVATAILRTSPNAPDFSTLLQPLRAEIAELARAPVAAIREAATTANDTVTALLPREPRTLQAPELQRIIEDGGLQYEAKLARLTDEIATDSRAPERVATELKGDLKGDLLRLLQAAREVGAASQLSATVAALDGIEARQATQTLAQSNATPYLLQLPFADGGVWRTLQLSLERESQPGYDDTANTGGRFRMLMHVPLSELGETWIDAGLANDRFRAAIYLDRAAVRDRVNAALPELQAELRAEGFSEVLLDVRSTADLPANAKQQSNAMAAGRSATTSLLDVRA